MKNLKILFAVISITLTSCISTPGIEEPTVTYCTIIDGEIAQCVGPNETKDVTVIDLIGATCLSPDDLAAAMTHHEALHKVIERLRRKK